MTDAAGRHELPAGAIRVMVTGPATGRRRDRGDREEAADASYFAPLAKARYLLLTTFKPKGTPVSAHVQGIVDDGGRAYFRVRSRSGMVRRLQQTDGVQVAPCGALGLWSYGPPLDATTRRLAGAEAGQVAGQLARKYPVRRRSLARLLPRAWRRRLVYYELLLRGSVAYIQTRRISLMCNGETSKLAGVFGSTVDNTALGNENPAALMMVSANDVTEATPSALTGGTAFTVTWDSSGTSAAAAPPATGPAPGSGGIPGRHHYHHWFDG
jgi:PPOX class probable F420-dependent enzyme